MAISQQDLEKDAETLYAMGAIYCKGNHSGAERNDHGVCPECEEVIAYSIHRTSVCPNDHKGNCKECSIHCYRPEMRAGIRQIMSYGAPRMIYKHPALTARYVRKKLNDRKDLKKGRP